MRVTVFGATGGVGGRVVERAIAAGHVVHAFVRDSGAAPVPGVTTTVGDLTDVEAMSRAVDGSDAVLWAVGASRNHPDQVALFETGARNLVTAMTRKGVRRLVALSGAGITIEGEQKSLPGRVMSAIVGRLVKHVVEAKHREYEVFRRSELEWTLVRPPRVVDRDPTGNYVAGDTLAGPRVTQGDLADFMVDQLTDSTYLREAPFVSS